MSNSNEDEIQRGHGSEERPVIGVLWERDSMGTNDIITSTGDYQPDHIHVDYKRYYDKDYAAAEVEKIWRKQWLFACREEDLPEVGDRLPFNVGPLSFIIMRSEQDTYQAFYNSCLHRGVMLCDKASSGDNIRCPYHGWEWNIDGSLNRIPSHWDFTGVTRKNGSLREVKLERWGGFIFINADPKSKPLTEMLSFMPQHFQCFEPEKRYTEARYRKTMSANWKIAQEAFLESYHLYATHPEGVAFNGDSQTQYDIWRTDRSAIGRTSVPGSVPSMHAPAEATAESAAMVFAQTMQAWHYPDAELPVIDSAGDVRAQMGAWHRKAYEQRYNRPIESTDAVMLDSILYFTFPHFCIWLSEAVPFVYQFLPHETDPEQCYFDVRLLKPYPEGEPRPPSSPAVILGPEDSIFEKVPGFGFLGMIFDQDVSNMPLIQKGIHAADPTRAYSHLGRYQESVIQHWNELLDQQMAAE